MEKFRRRIFYNLNTGEVITCYSAKGALKRNFTEEAEALQLGIQNWGVFSWDEPNEEIEAAFSSIDSEGGERIVNVSVNISTNPPTLEFSYSEPVEPEQPQDYAGIIDILTGEVE